jgi:putative ABC transport system permease protein
MNIRENILVSLDSIGSNLLRTVLTALIIAIGIASLVGILTAIDGMQQSINENMANLGANTFNIEARGAGGQWTQQGVQDKIYPPITYQESKKFKEMYTASVVSVSTSISGSAEVKAGSKKTNPNVSVVGGDGEFLILEGYDLKEGRNFSEIEVSNGANVAIVGSDIVKTLFGNVSPIDKDISLFGRKYRIVGVIEEQGQMSGGSVDRSVLIPLENSRRMAPSSGMRFTIKVSVPNPANMEFAMGEATGLMRSVRQDRIGEDSSFEVKRNETLAESMAEITGYLRLGGGVIGFITLLGASIGLMNIMMVSVTERTREIGVRKALGATPLRIRQQFLIEAIVICLIGGMAGIFLGIIIGNLVSNLISDGGLIIPWFWMVVGVIVCIVVGLASGYFPAHKASRLDPIESLRFE